MTYTNALGITPLRDRIARHYKDWYNLDIDPNRVAVTPGSSVAFQLAFLSSFDAGARIGLIEPGYPPYRAIVAALGLEPVLIPVGPETRYQPTPAMLDKAGPLDGILIASPANPTGSMLTTDELRALLAWAKKNDCVFISDEIYHGLSYGRDADCALAFDDDAIIINSMSKFFCMTGWRLGWMILPETLIPPVEKLAQNMFISAAAPSQFAALTAFDHADEMRTHIDQYARNREILLNALPKAGFGEAAPADGAFYVYCDASRLTNDSLQFCMDVLQKTGVALTPGLDFDPQRGNRFVRFSYAGTEENVTKAAEKLVKTYG